MTRQVVAAQHAAPVSPLCLWWLLPLPVPPLRGGAAAVFHAHGPVGPVPPLRGGTTGGPVNEAQPTRRWRPGR